ncbi:MAG: hypothetical protein AB4368_31705 [Xenococcaceae cyanobacterium]
MNEMDDLLAQIKAEYEPKKPSSLAKTKQNKSQKNLEDQSDRELDNILSDLETEFTREKPQNKGKSPQNSTRSVVKTESFSTRSPSTFNNNLLEDLKEEYQEKDREVQKRKQQELQEQQRREQQKKQRRRQALRQEAQKWLQNLDLNTDEGLWFEEFSYAYDSKLEAAIDYLEAIRETRRLS